MHFWAIQMTTVNITPTPVQRFVDSNGNALVGGQLFTYQAGTTTKVATYTDSTGTVQNTNPIVLNQRGECTIWLLPSQSYKFVLATPTDTDPPQSPIWTEDNITGTGGEATGNMTDEKGSGGQIGFVAGVDFTDGSTTSLTLSNNYGSVDNIWVAFDAALQGADQYTLGGAANETLTFNSPIPVGTEKVYVKGGTSLTIGTPGTGTVVDASVAPGSKLYNRITDIIDVRDFGAKVDGVTDDTAAVTTAVAYAASINACLWFPAGTCLCSPTSPITAASPVMLRGAGKYNSIIKTTQLNAQIFSFSSSYVCLEDLQLSGPAAPTSGYLLTLFCENEILNRVCFASYYNAVNATGNTGMYRDCDFNAAATTSSVGLTVNGYAGGLLVDGLLFPVPTVTPIAGIMVTTCGSLQISNCNIIKQGTNLLVIPGNGQQADSIACVNTCFDSAQNFNIHVAPATGGVVGRMTIDQCEASSSTSYGVAFDGSAGSIDGVVIQALSAHFCGVDGILLAGANINSMQIISAQACGNVSHGLNINCSNVHAGRVFAGAGFGASGNAYGIYIQPGMSDIILDDCDCNGNTTANIVDGTGGVATIRNCQGYTSVNTGTNAIAASSTSTVVTHGLSSEPPAQWIQLTPLGPFSATPYVDPTSINGATFTVRTATAPGSSTSFGWRATCNQVQ